MTGAIDGRAGTVLEASAVSFSYAAARVLSDVDLSVHEREFVALVGPNGCGKSTLLRVLLGFLVPERGTARIFGEHPTRLRQRWRVGYVPQKAVFDEHVVATVDEVVSAGRLTRRPWYRRPSPADRAACERALDAVDLLALRHRPIHELSGGQQQRALIAKGLAGDPQLLVLDEPTAGVDAQSQRRFRDTLVGFRDAGGAVLLVSHELGAVADDLDRVVVLRRGRIELDESPDVLSARGVNLGVHDSDLPVWLEGPG